MVVALLGLCGCGGGTNDGADVKDVAVEEVREPEDTGPVMSTWLDPGSGLTWQNPGAPEAMNLVEAAAYCDALELDGTGWQLPTIDQFRTLVRGCPATEPWGACNVASQTCMAWNCRVLSCEGCPPKEGPAAGGCYWPDELEGLCTWYWSRSRLQGEPGKAWYVNFPIASIFDTPEVNDLNVRCVR